MTQKQRVSPHGSTSSWRVRKNEHQEFMWCGVALTGEKKNQNFQRKLNFALIDMIKQLYSSNVTNAFLG